MAKNETPDFDKEDASLLDDASARAAKLSKIDSILGKSPKSTTSGVDLTPQTAEERSDDRRLRMEERRRNRNARIAAASEKDSARIRQSEGTASPTVRQPARKDNAVLRALREEPDFEPDTPSGPSPAGRPNTAAEAGAWFRENPGAVEDLRAMGRSIDPNAAAVHRARTSGRGTVFEFGSREHANMLDPASASKAADVVGNERIGGMGGIMSGNENAAISTDYDPADTGPRVFGGTSFYEPAHISSPFERYKAEATPQQLLELNVGKLYLRQAGRCDHPLCKAKRARGLQLMGRPVSSRKFTEGVESGMAPIPSVATTKREYPINPETGKQDRKNPTSFLEVKPADPKGAEWQEAQSLLSTDESNIFLPEDLLEHHHGPGDMDLERHLPWHPKYKGPQ